MRKFAPAALIALLLAGCVDPATPQDASDPGLIVDEERPLETYGAIVTGPAVGPDLNATTAAAPRLVEGEWWRVRFENYLTGAPVDVVRVVANATPEGYVMGMPHEGWLKEAIAFHSPAFGDVALDLSYATHNERFEPVRFPLEEGATWETKFALTPYTAVVESADQHTAAIRFTMPEDPQPTDPLTDLLGLTGQDMSMRLTYDAREHEIVRMESPLGTWEVIEHGYDFEGWVTVPRGEHTAIDYGVFLPASEGHDWNAREIEVAGGFNRLTLMHLIVPLAPGSFEIRTVDPVETEFKTTATDEFTIRFYETRDVDGTWTVQDTVGGAGAHYSMGIAYHQYDIRLPDGQRRADHSHEVIR